MQFDSFWYGILIIVALLVFGWRIRKSLKIIRDARAAKKSAPLIEWVYMAMGLFLAVLFVLNAFGLVNN
jgi:hypothetical protein